LTRTPQLRSLNLKKEDDKVSYQDLVPTLKQLTSLQKIDMTNCGIEDDKQFSQIQNLQITNPKPTVVKAVPPVEQLPLVTNRPPVIVSPPPPPRQLVAIKEEVTFSAGIQREQVIGVPNGGTYVNYASLQKRVVNYYSDGTEEKGTPFWTKEYIK
jgi:hypothetical protein